MECVDKLIRKDMIHPLTDEKLTEKDIIPMERVRRQFDFIYFFDSILIVSILLFNREVLDTLLLMINWRVKKVVQLYNLKRN